MLWNTVFVKYNSILLNVKTVRNFTEILKTSSFYLILRGGGKVGIQVDSNIRKM